MKKAIPVLLALFLIFSLMTLMTSCQSKGDKGDTGPIGPQGPQGIQGPKGDPGSPSVIDIIVNPPSGNGGYIEVPSLVNGMPIIKNGYHVNICGSGFVVGETVTFIIADHNQSFNIGTTTVISNAGVFLWDTWANWPSYTWQASGHYYGAIKAVGDKGSTAVSFVNIGQE